MIGSHNLQGVLALCDEASPNAYLLRHQHDPGHKAQRQVRPGLLPSPRPIRILARYGISPDVDPRP